MADYPVSIDIDTFMQSADKAAMRTNMDLGTAATKDVAATGDAAAGEVVKGDDTRLTDARTPTSHTHTASEITDFDTEVANNTTVAANTSKLAGIEAGAEVNNISDTNATDLTDGGDSTLHYHSADRARANHTGTQTLSTISDAGTAASKDFPAAGDAAAGEVVLGNDSRLTDARTPVSHTHTASDITDFDTEVSNNVDVAANTSKLAGIEAGAEVNNISDTNATDLTDGGDSTLHYHSADRSRANHTGTQTLSTISDAGTIASQNSNSVTITGGSVTGITDLAIADGGTGASTASAARTNLEVYSDAEVDAKVATKATAGGVAWTTGTAAGNAAIDFGTADFSLSGVVVLSDYTPSAAITFFKSHSTGNNTVQLQLQTDGDWRLIFTDNGGTAANYDLVPSALTNGNAYQFVVTADRDGNAQLYIDGATSGSAVSISAESAVDIGSGNTNAYQIASVRNDFRIFNRALSAAEVADLYESGTVAVVDRWGGTEIPDWSSTVDGWTGASYSISQEASFTDSASVTKNNVVTGTLSAVGEAIFTNNNAKFGAIGQVTKLSGWVYSDTADIKIAPRGSPTHSNVSGSVVPTSGEWTQFTAFSQTQVSGYRYSFSITNNLGGNLPAGAVVKFADVEVTTLGAIADLPLDEGIGYQFHDRSSNHFDALASTTGITHLVPKTEGKVRVKAADASSAMYMLRADSILPTDSIISNVLSEQCYVDLTNSAQVLDDYRIRLNPSGSDLQIQRSDGSNHATLGTVTAPSSLSDVDVQIHYEQVAR